MEWVETTGKSIEEAKEAALDQLGVDEADAELEILEEPRSGLFGRTRGLARVRARVVPRAPRPKAERRRRGRGEGKGEGKAEGKAEGKGAEATGTGGRPADGEGTSRGGGNGRGGRTRDGGQRSQGGARSQGTRTRGGDAGGDAARSGGRSGSGARRNGDVGGSQGSAQDQVREIMDATEQCETVEGFLTGLCGAFGLDAEVTVAVDEDGVVRAAVTGDGLGLLVGPRLGTLEAIQEVCRNTLQRQAAGREHGKVVLDVGGVRELRREALSRFVTETAEQVRSGEGEVVFEVMSSADRKIVHDTVAELDGVESGSIGEDPRRRVVVRPA